MKQTRTWNDSSSSSPRRSCCAALAPRGCSALAPCRCRRPAPHSRRSAPPPSPSAAAPPAPARLLPISAGGPSRASAAAPALPLLRRPATPCAAPAPHQRRRPLTCLCCGPRAAPAPLPCHPVRGPCSASLRCLTPPCRPCSAASSRRAALVHAPRAALAPPPRAPPLPPCTRPARAEKEGRPVGPTRSDRNEVVPSFWRYENSDVARANQKPQRRFVLTVSRSVRIGVSNSAATPVHRKPSRADPTAAVCGARSPHQPGELPHNH
ncbi:atherin-like isoform X2 [Brachypodium distachyon]|uniref:atherin-like isoform X2 n=1 Tax=Brachypodium distachyon TaxID=15368 RepID=UPI000D0CFEE5|nr:atherin-like isoform X2 [Brachypodium distachyon]|eukprot:XP_024316641.1 atherin-like isoform X2 [Brachypodium distachyon]